MKKILLTLAILMISNVALACGGITITGKSGATYCLSKFSMNWYTAYAWCKDQGMDLIEVDTVCGTNVSNCSDLRLSSDEKSKITSVLGSLGLVWTKTSNTAIFPFYVVLTDASIGSAYHRGINCYALCK